MTSEKYVVLCCPVPEGTARVIAWIDDDRASGGPIRIHSNTNFRVTLSVPRASGSIVTYGIGCKNCHKEVQALSEATAADVIDKVLPVRDTLEVKDIPALDEGIARWHQNLLPPDRRRTAPAPALESRYVIPLPVLCQIVSKIRDAT